MNAYQRARKAVLKDFVPPSTSVLMDELLVEGVNMDVSMLAVLPGGNREPKAAQPDGVPVPQHSGFIASLVSGDYVFVAGQMPNNDEMTAIAKPAYRAPNAVWNGTDIRLQTEFLITSRLKPALEAGGSSIKNAIKAQVYLTNIQDLPEFMDVWDSHFGASPRASRWSPRRGWRSWSRLLRSTFLECAIPARSRSRSSITSPPLICDLGPRRCVPRTCCAYRPSMRPMRTVRFPGARFRWAKIFWRPRSPSDGIDSDDGQWDLRSGGSLTNLVRANHFVGDLNVVHPMLRTWQKWLAGAPIPFGVVRAPPPMPVPGCDITADLWVYHPH